jgi:hypothetical protein
MRLRSLRTATPGPKASPMIDLNIIHHPVKYEPTPLSRLVRAAKDLPGVMFFAGLYAFWIWS